MKLCNPSWVASCIGAAALLAGCAGGPEPLKAARSADELAAACITFQGSIIGPQRIGLPSGEAKLESAQWVPSAPAYCRLLGAIAPLDPKAPKIHFQLNLPANWNGKALQYGGGGFNGVLITGTTLTIPS